LEGTGAIDDLCDWEMRIWSVVNGLTGMDLGSRCNAEWQKRLVKVKQEHKVTGATPYSRPAA